MTDMNVQLTKVAQGSANQQALAGASTGAAAKIAGGGNFWDFLLSGLTKGEENSLAKISAKTQTPATPSKDAAASKDKNPLALLQIALANQTLDADGNIVLPEGSATLEESLQKQLSLTDTIINHLQNAVPENSENGGIFNQLLSKLKAKSETLQASLAALETGTITKDTPVEDIPFPLLISLGLNPAEISKVAEDIQALEEKLGRDITVEDLIAGVGGILAPAPEVAATVKTASLGKQIDPADPLAGIDDTTEPTDDLAARLNALDVGGEDVDGDALAQQKSATTATSAKTPATPFAPTTDEAAQSLLTGAEKSAARDAMMEPEKKIAADTTDAKIKPDNVSLKNNLVSIPSTFSAQMAVTGDSNLSADLFATDSSNSWSQLGLNASPSLSLGTAAQAANMSASHAHAGQTHPATQLVSASLMKAGKDGSADTVNIQLDPPELGSVNVRLEFGKDKTVKAHLLVEKPETYLMLQRDGLALERALQNAGLDANSQSLSFELAQDNGAFGHDNNGQGANDNTGGRGKAGEPDEAVIQSTMTWQVDETTGHVRYNIFA